MFVCSVPFRINFLCFPMNNLIIQSKIFIIKSCAFNLIKLKFCFLTHTQKYTVLYFSKKKYPISILRINNLGYLGVICVCACIFRHFTIYLQENIKLVFTFFCVNKELAEKLPWNYSSFDLLSLRAFFILVIIE